MASTDSTRPLEGQVVVITGASSGFGKGTALTAAAGGASLVLAARREGLLDELADQCRQAGGQAEAVVTDVGVADQVERLAGRATGAFGRIDAWINNAGVGAVGRFEDIPLDVHERLIRTDVLGTIYGSHVALRHFRRRGGGTLVNVASALGKIAVPYYAWYVAAKFAVVGLGVSLRQELEHGGAGGIHVCTVMPMANDTPFFEHAANYTGHDFDPPPPVYDPQHVIDALVGLLTEPEDEIVVGAAGKASNVAHRLAPGLVEKSMGWMTDRVTMKDRPPAADTPGSVHQPMAAGAGITGGLRK